MWEAGDDYFEVAKAILNKSYAASRPSTCQALLLLVYREIGIGAMAQSWIYTGMAIRMAQVNFILCTTYPCPHRSPGPRPSSVSGWLGQSWPWRQNIFGGRAPGTQKNMVCLCRC